MSPKLIYLSRLILACLHFDDTELSEVKVNVATAPLF